MLQQSTDSIDIDYIKDKIDLILKKVHTDSKKQKSLLKHDRISMACPICGDSHKDNLQKRGHLFLNNLYYKCYNENCRSTFTKLCKDFDIHLEAEKRIQLINYIDLHITKIQELDENWLVGELDKLIKYDDLLNWFKSGKGPLKAVQKIQFGSQCYMYLLERGIPENIILEHFHEGIYENGKWSEPYLIFLNTIGDKILGMQIRNLKSKEQRRFKIFTFKEIYDSIYNTDMDLIESIAYNKLSYLFNVLNVNYDREITIFEGYLDSLFMKNSIGAVGINTDYSYLLYAELNIRFFFDNDNTGKKKSYDWLKKGYKVFLWEKLISDLSKKHNDPYQFKSWFNKNIKDLNALIIKHKIPSNELNKYFSNKIEDTIYLNFTKFKIKEKKEINIHNIDWNKKILELTNGRK